MVKVLSKLQFYNFSVFLVKILELNYGIDYIILLIDQS